MLIVKGNFTGPTSVNSTYRKLAPFVRPGDVCRVAHPFAFFLAKGGATSAEGQAMPLLGYLPESGNLRALSESDR